MINILLLFLIFWFTFFGVNASKFVDCPKKDTDFRENRKLFVATCDSRLGYKSHWALRAWNSSGYNLRKKNNLPMINVCYGKSWKTYEFLTKPMLYKNYVSKLPQDAYIILMDSDTFWAVDDVSTIWHRFDCARNGKEMVLSTEMQCWIGRYCNEDDIKRWYSDVTNIPTYSPFANSGVVMGKNQQIIEMLDYVIKNNKKYFIEKPGNKYKFDDQYAYVDYAITLKPDIVALDYHQQLLSSFSVHVPALNGEEPERWGFRCKRKNGTISMHCPDYTQKMMREGYFHLDQKSCELSRKLPENGALNSYLESISPHTVIWHGNGVGKRVYSKLHQDVFACFLRNHEINLVNWQSSWHK